MREIDWVRTVRVEGVAGSVDEDVVVLVVAERELAKSLRKSTSICSCRVAVWLMRGTAGERRSWRMEEAVWERAVWVMLALSCGGRERRTVEVMFVR